LSDILRYFKISGNYKKTKKYANGAKISIERKENKNEFSNTSATYILKIKSKGVQKDYFIKEVNSKKDRSYNTQFLMGLTGVYELQGVFFVEKYLKKKPLIIQGFNLEVLEGHVAYEDINTKKSYIMYDFTTTLPLKKAQEKGLISKEFLEEVNRKLRSFCSTMNEDLKNNFDSFKKYGISRNQSFDDISSRNVFIDFENKRLILSDVWLKTK
jgi:hypothetical protein